MKKHTVKNRTLESLGVSSPVIRNLNRSKLTYTMCKKILEKFVGDPLFDFCYNSVSVYFKEDERKTVKWFFLENPLLGKARPVELLLLGQQEKLVEFILSVKDAGGVN